MASRLVRRAEAAGLIGISTMTLDRMVKDGRIPQPIRVSPRVIGWRSETLQEWMKDRECIAQK